MNTSEQYTLKRIMLLWALVTGPMALLAWVVRPWLVPRVSLPPAITGWLLMVAGLMWQFVLSTIVLRHELGPTWRQRVSGRIGLRLPTDPATGRASARLFVWAVPCLLGSFLFSGPLAEVLNAPLAWLGLQMPSSMNPRALVDPQFKGAWWLVLLALVSSVFNYVLGEELFFRGVLLPKMRGVFGRCDWVFNALLFAGYHLHTPWALGSITLSSLLMAWPARRFQSLLLSVVVHGAAGVVLLVLVVGVVLGVVS